MLRKYDSMLAKKKPSYILKYSAVLLVLIKIPYALGRYSWLIHITFQMMLGEVLALALYLLLLVCTFTLPPIEISNK